MKLPMLKSQRSKIFARSLAREGEIDETFLEWSKGARMTSISLMERRLASARRLP